MVGRASPALPHTMCVEPSCKPAETTLGHADSLEAGDQPGCGGGISPGPQRPSGCCSLWAKGSHGCLAVQRCVAGVAVAAVAVLCLFAKQNSLDFAEQRHFAVHTHGSAHALRKAGHGLPSGFDKLALSQRFLARGRTCPVVDSVVGGSRSVVDCFGTVGGGWGNIVWGALGNIATAAESESMHVPVLRVRKRLGVGSVPDEAFLLSNWFQKAKVDADLERQCVMGDATCTQEGCDSAPQEHIWQATPEERHTGGCAMRKYMNHPSVALWERLSVSVVDLKPWDVVVSMHLRFGDLHIARKEWTSNCTPDVMNYKCSRLDGTMLDEMHTFLVELVRGLESQDTRLRVRLFVASDVPEGVEEVEKRWGGRVLPHVQKVAHHSGFRTNESGTVRRSRVADLISDWFLLAMSDVLLLPMDSTFSGTAEVLGMHGPCHFRRFRRDRIIAPCIEAIMRSL